MQKCMQQSTALFILFVLLGLGIGVLNVYTNFIKIKIFCRSKQVTKIDILKW